MKKFSRDRAIRRDAPLLRVRDLRTVFQTARGPLTAVDGVNFDLYPGEVLGLVGESGSGKSVTLRSLVRLIGSNGRIEGSVLVAFTIQPDGSVSDARSLSAQPAGVFEDAALAAASRWRFEASGRRVATTRTLMFRLPANAKG